MIDTTAPRVTAATRRGSTIHFTAADFEVRLSASIGLVVAHKGLLYEVSRIAGDRIVAEQMNSLEVARWRARQAYLKDTP